MSDQLPLVGPRGGLHPRPPRPEPPPVGVARVLPDAGVPELSRPFDYAIPARLADRVVAGCRVRVRLSGRQCDAFVLSIDDASDYPGRLRLITSVVSALPVLTPAVLEVCQQVADHFAGTLADVLRFAVPPRVASLEAGWAPAPPHPHPVAVTPRRAAEVLPPDTDWAELLLDRARAVLATGRRVLLLVPDSRAVDRLQLAAVARGLGERTAVLRADDGGSVRYQQFLRVLAGSADLVLGTRAAAFAPVPDLGLAIIWDDIADTYAEPRTPFWHAREVLAFRSTIEQCDLLLAGPARSCEAQRWVEAGWLAEATDEAGRARRPRVRTAEQPLEPFDDVRRIPAVAVRLIRDAATAGPVLVAVSRAGHIPVTACQECRTIAECRLCSGPLAIEADGAVRCRRCGVGQEFDCPECGSTRLRAVVTGATRTAEELQALVPGVPVVVSTAGTGAVAEIGPEPAIVVATPGLEPRCPTGYVTAYLPDAQHDLWRPELRARERAVARWLRACADVRPGARVMINADPADPTVQAFVRWDPIGFATGELERRRELHLPPGERLLEVDGPAGPLAELQAVLPEQADVLGPRELDDGRLRLLVRAPDFARLQASVVEHCRAHQVGSPGWRIQVDPPEVE